MIEFGLAIILFPFVCLFFFCVFGLAFALACQILEGIVGLTIRITEWFGRAAFYALLVVVVSVGGLLHPLWLLSKWAWISITQTSRDAENSRVEQRQKDEFRRTGVKQRPKRTQIKDADGKPIGVGHPGEAQISIPAADQGAALRAILTHIKAVDPDVPVRVIPIKTVKPKKF